MSNNNPINRRQFVKKSSAAVAVFSIVPRHVLGGKNFTAPSEKLNIAGIGIGGMGAYDVSNCKGENIYALCDVDPNHAARVFNAYPKAKKYVDYREMLEKEKDIDAVVVATPDHTHAVIAMAAIKAGKHIYVEKPMTHNIYETRANADFEYSGPFTEMIHLGNIAIKLGRKLYWDSEKMEFTNDPEATKLLTRDYRQGWSL